MKLVRRGGRLPWLEPPADLSGGNSASKALAEHLVDRFRPIDVAQLMLAEAQQLDAVGEVALHEGPRRVRHEHLPTVRRGCDPRRAMDVDTDVVIAAQRAEPRVDAHPDADFRAVGPRWQCAGNAARRRPPLQPRAPR